MKKTNRSTSRTLLTYVAIIGIVASLAGRVSTSVPTFAAPGQRDERADKVGHKLRKRVRDNTASSENVSVILQLNGQKSPRLQSLLKRNGIRLKKDYSNFNSSSIELPANVVEELASHSEVDSINEDDEVIALGHLTSTTGADDVRTQTSSTGATTTLDGTGIGIAILDSGIYAGHKSLAPRVVYNQDFTGENRVDDPYGHGTHVAASAAGNGSLYKGNYTGIAPNANLINLRVLDSKGRSKTSTVLSALNWVFSNRASYNIRVVNVSLGGAAISSYKNDPLCIAVRRLVDAGVVVVAAAGNDGKDAFGRKQYGGVHAPGNEPSAITVGATNSFGTNSRSDDAVTSYSSRGPTRSFWTDNSGVRHYDNLVKPDLVAPGNKVISAQAANNLLVEENPSLETGMAAGRDNQKMMYLSGTSVSAPVVAGAAALMLQANPKLTPNMIKMLLMYTAQQLPNMNMLEQGAGQLNIEGAVKLAKLVRTDLTNSTTVGSPLLTSAAPTPQSTIDGTSFMWAQGILSDQGYAKGLSLITKYQKIYGTGVLISDATLQTNGVLVADLTMLSSGVLISDCILISNGTTIGSGINLLPSGVLVADGVLLADGVLVADGVLISDGVLVADGVLISDSILAKSNLLGDLTAFMQ